MLTWGVLWGQKSQKQANCQSNMREQNEKMDCENCGNSSIHFNEFFWPCKEPHIHDYYCNACGYSPVDALISRQL